MLVGEKSSWPYTHKNFDSLIIVHLGTVRSHRVTHNGYYANDKYVSRSYTSDCSLDSRLIHVRTGLVLITTSYLYIAVNHGG